jgi:hypothetical protein
VKKILTQEKLDLKNSWKLYFPTSLAVMAIVIIIVFR